MRMAVHVGELDGVAVEVVVDDDLSLFVEKPLDEVRN